MTTLPPPESPARSSVVAVELPARPTRVRIARPTFSTRELRRVAAASTLNIAGIIAVVLLLLPIVGYNSTAQAFPKSLLDGAVIAMLMGQRTRWRNLALFGVVVGMFLAFVVPAIPPLLGIYAIAGLAAAAIGWSVAKISRPLAIVAAAVVFAVVDGAGYPVQVYFASQDRNEPVIWFFVGIEVALRSIGAPLGVLIGTRWAKRLADRRTTLSRSPSYAVASPRRVREQVSPAYSLVIIAAALLACSVPMFVHNVWLLAAIAAAYALLAIAVNQGRSVLQVAIVLVWGWGFYGLCSFLWHHDWLRVADFGRTLALRFLPMATIALVMIRTVRPVAVVRLLRKARVSGAVVLPLSMVLRAVPTARRDIVGGIAAMKRDGLWTNGRLTPLRHPVLTSGRVLSPLVARWGAMLAE